MPLRYVPKFAYVTNGNSNDVSAYTINSATGALTAVTGSPFAAGTGPTSVAVDPWGRFLYVANGGFPGSVSVYVINPTNGALTALASLSVSGTPAGVAVDPTGKFVYVTNSETNTIYSAYAYIINRTTGALTEIGNANLGAAPNNPGFGSVAVHPSGKFVYFSLHYLGGLWIHHRYYFRQPDRFGWQP